MVGGCAHGWTDVCRYALRTSVNCLLLKRLDAVWKGIADTVATLFVFIYAVTIFGEKPGPAVDLKVSA